MTNHDNNNNAKSQANEIKLGVADIKKGDLVAALIKLSEVIGQHPGKPSLLIKRCDCLMAMAKYDLAIKDALAAIKADGKFRGAYYRLMDCYLLLGERQKAEGIVERFRIIAPQIDSIESNQVAKIEKLKLLQGNIVNYMNENNQKQCLKNVNEALKISPAYYDLLFIKIRCLVVLKRLPEAEHTETHLCAALSQNLDFLEALKIYYDGQFDKSFKMLKRIAARLRREIKSFNHFVAKVECLTIGAAKAETLLVADQLEEAVKMFINCLKVDPSHNNSQKIFRIKITKAVFERDYSEAILCATSSLKFDPTLVEVLLLRAKAYFELKRYIDALDDCQKVLDLNVSNQLKDFAERLKIQIIDVSTNASNVSSENKHCSDNEAFDSSAHQNDKRKFLEEYARCIYGRIENKSDTARKIKNPPKTSNPMSNQKATESTHSKSYKNIKEFNSKTKVRENSNKEKQNEIQAELKNKEACEEYRTESLEKALNLYSEAIRLCPRNAVYRTNRAGCFIKLEKIEQAISDAVKAVDVDPGYSKGYLRAVNCFLLSGDVNQAQVYIEKFKNNIVGIDSIEYNEIPKIESLKATRDKIAEFYNEGNYKDCLKHLDLALNIATFCVNYRNMKAECLIMLGNNEMADEIINKVVAANPRDANMMFLRGLKFYFRNELIVSLGKIDDALRADPDLTKAHQLRTKIRKISKNYAEGMASFKSKNFDDALQSFTSAANVDPSNKKMKLLMLYNRGITDFKLERFKDAFNDFTEVLRIDEAHIKSLNRRALAHFKLKEFEDCIIDCEESLKLKASDVIKKLMDGARLSVTARNHYDVLCVTSKSTSGEIKKQFHKMSLMFHTDKHPLATSIEKKKLERKFNEMTSAYNSLKSVHNL